MADRALELLDRFGIADVELVERVDHAVGEHQERGLVEMRNQEQQEILMPELSEQPAVAINEEALAARRRPWRRSVRRT